MDKRYDHTKHEKNIYSLWEKSGVFTPKIDKKKKPYTILLPLPNANDPMHMGHALFTVEDILIRYHRMLGDPTLWLPGGDHAGIETQYVFEKHLAKKGKSRFDYDRNTLYKKISDFANQNKDLNKSQMKKLGFSMDWSRYHYSLEPKIVKTVKDTFRKLHKDGLVYRANRMVNYCTKCGTSFSDLEIKHKEINEYLYYLNYGTIKIATTRPETIFADTAVAVNPKDKRYKDLIGKEATIPLTNRKIPIITDSAIEIDFGTGALKVTPAHDPTDYEIGLRHKLEIIQTIDRDGKMINVPEKYSGMSVNSARENVIKDLIKKDKLVKKESYKHTISTCYKCTTTIEPMLSPQWFVKTKPLAKPAIEAVKKGVTKIFPKKRFEKLYFDWMENILDWNISRQIVWGPRIPAWYCLEENEDIQINFINKEKQIISATYKELKEKYPFEEIKDGLQSLSAPTTAKYSLDDNKVCNNCGSKKILQETDTFDTWFLSGQWPLTTLGFPVSPDFKYFYPTSVLDTLWDILFFWVARMMMLGLYRAKKVPFKVVHLHARVVDEKGKKMSKSRGNVINPIEMVEKYSADALRMALVYGVAPASDVVVSEDKIRAMRNFANKVWNMARFLTIIFEKYSKPVPFYSKSLVSKLNKDDKKIISSLEKTITKVNSSLEKYRFSDAAESIYHFMWDELASSYIEKTKNREDKNISLSVLRHCYLTSLKLLHPFMPFVTETIWQEIKNLRDKKESLLITSSWPDVDQ